MIKKLGPHLLRKGVVLSSSEILDLILEVPKVSSSIEAIAIDSFKISAEKLLSRLEQNREWEVQILFD